MSEAITQRGFVPSPLPQHPSRFKFPEGYVPRRMKFLDEPDNETGTSLLDQYIGPKAPIGFQYVEVPALTKSESDLTKTPTVTLSPSSLSELDTLAPEILEELHIKPPPRDSAATRTDEAVFLREISSLRGTALHLECMIALLALRRVYLHLAGTPFTPEEIRKKIPTQPQAMINTLTQTLNAHTPRGDISEREVYEWIWGAWYDCMSAHRCDGFVGTQKDHLERIWLGEHMLEAGSLLAKKWARLYVLHPDPYSFPFPNPLRPDCTFLLEPSVITYSRFDYPEDMKSLVQPTKSTTSQAQIGVRYIQKFDVLCRPLRSHFRDNGYHSLPGHLSTVSVIDFKTSPEFEFQKALIATITALQRMGAIHFNACFPTDNSTGDSARSPWINLPYCNPELTAREEGDVFYWGINPFQRPDGSDIFPSYPMTGQTHRDMSPGSIAHVHMVRLAHAILQRGGMKKIRKNAFHSDTPVIPGDEFQPVLFSL